MALTEVEICNDALILLGADRISSLTEDTKEAILCNEQYPKMRDQLLISHPWNFAIARTEMAQDSELPEGYDDDVWEYSHSLAADVLRVISVDEVDAEWKIEGRKLFAHYTPVKIKYIKKITDVTLFSKFFEESLAWKLAARIGYALTQNATLMESILKQAEEHLRNARSYDAQEGSLEVVEAEDWLDTRY